MGRAILKDYVRGKLLYVHAPPALTAPQKDAFYGRRTKSRGVNVVDQRKLDRLANGDEEFVAEEESENSEAEVGDLEAMEQELAEQQEFLDLWQHPMHAYGGSGGVDTSKKKHVRKARVLRRIERKKVKTQRAMRRDADQFKHGSNAVIIS